jgi:hypothetical protein
MFRLKQIHLWIPPYIKLRRIALTPVKNLFKTVLFLPRIALDCADLGFMPL